MARIKVVFAFFVGIVVAASLVWPTDAVGQAGPQTAPGTAGTEKKLEVEGKIRTVDPSGMMVTLEDGTHLIIPSAVRVQLEALKEGATVKASYAERNGQKVVTSMVVRP